CFTRNPSTGEPALYGEYLANAQGEDVVSGARTPKPIAGLADEMPKMYEELVANARKLEQHYRDAQDIEFTVEHGKLYMLQTRSAKRNAAAAIRMAVDMVSEGLVRKEEALLRVPANDLSQLLLPRFDEASKKKAVDEGRLLGSGLNASPGAATGRAVFESGAVALAAESGPVILVRPETSPDDMPGILRSAAVLTSRGGITSHAAVVTRGLGKPAVVGASDLRVDTERGTVSANGASVSEGEQISVDGYTGEVFSGHIDTVDPDVHANTWLLELLTWANETKRMGVRANADTPHDAEVALGFGAEGIGLCRTEHMFFDSDKDNPQRFPWVQDMLMYADDYYAALEAVEGTRAAAVALEGDALTEAQRQLREAEARLQETQRYIKALAKLEEYQTADFEGILRAMDGKPVVIRLLDPPLHEFLPPLETLIEEVAVLKATHGDTKALEEKEQLLSVARRLHEQNPMMGHRGCRLGLTYPDVYEMQVRAIVKAALNLRKQGLNPHPEVMIPLVMDAAEVKSLKTRLAAAAAKYERETGKAIPFGTMIELPRAALTAGEIAPEVSFFSFGSNDLTQMTFGFSRDDAEEKFLRFYVDHGILPVTPFRTIDEKGVGRLIRIAAQEGREANPKLELGICGEHGGDPQSIEFCHRTGLTYVSCSPMR
ncbi:MAG TPA: putative PEP-binding protein, partial [Dehalococcoidia bacterium]|nr:putative PEP-binding protein [Dehalococcoidia bacterium]